MSQTRANSRISEWKAGEPPTFAAALSEYKSSEVKLAPTAVAVEASSGDFWVAESAQNHMVEFNPERKYVRQFGSAGTGNGQFNGIGAIATNSSRRRLRDRPGQPARAGVRTGRQIHHAVAGLQRERDRRRLRRQRLGGHLGTAERRPITKYSSSGTLLSDFGTPAAPRASSASPTAWPSPAGTSTSPN